MNRHSQLLSFAAAAATAILAHAAWSATVERVTLSQMLEASEFVFHGSVEDMQVLRMTSDEDIVTRVRFRVHEVIKGRIRPSVVHLDFAGGTYGRLTLSYSDQRMPTLGEEGVYFAESLSERLLNPLYGWSQGHFIVRYSRGEPIIHTSDLRPVYDVQPGDLEQSEFSAGIAVGVETEKAWQLQGPISLAAFKSKLRAMAGDSQ